MKFPHCDMLANVFLEVRPFLIIYSYFLKGKTRFKFDVWSNDVTLANQMESTGRPGMVHISEKTYGFLKNDYLVEDGDDIGGKKVVDVNYFEIS